MKKTVLLSVSSITGNTAKIADAIRKELEIQNWNIIECKEDDKFSMQKQAELIIVCFWCRKSTLDDKSRQVVDSLEGKQVLAFGTMGSYADGEYGQRVAENVEKYINQKNQCRGVFLCRGKIDPKRTEARRKLPKDHPHYLNDEGLERHLASRKHPTEKDIKEAISFLHTTLLGSYDS